MRYFFQRVFDAIVRTKTSLFRWFYATTVLLIFLDQANRVVYNYLHHTFDESVAMYGMRGVYLVFLALYWLVYWRYLRRWHNRLPVFRVRFRAPRLFLKKMLLRTVKVSVLLTCISQFNLVRPWYLFAADFKILVADYVLTFSNTWNEYENVLVFRGQRWMPSVFELPYYRSVIYQQALANNVSAERRRIAFVDRVVSRAAKSNNVPEWVLFGTILAESGMRMGCLPRFEDDGSGGSEGGPTQQQSLFAEHHGDWTVGIRGCYMNKKDVYNTRIDHQRIRFLTFLCGIDLPSPLDLIRYFLVSSIDDRMSMRTFDTTARVLRTYYEQAKKINSQSGSDFSWTCALAKWRTNSFSPKSRTLVKRYVRLGKQYVSWKQSLRST